MAIASSPTTASSATESRSAAGRRASSAAYAAAVRASTAEPESRPVTTTTRAPASSDASTRVTTFGEPTAGALDYQNVSIVRLLPNERRWFLGYPTITAHPDLPAGGVRGKGVRPDVRMDLAHEPDPIARVARALAAEH